jgi:ATP-dependent Clp protease ATP-binding subunit ClpX
MPVLSYLNPLNQEALKRILTEPKNALTKQYQKLFDMEGIVLTFEDKAIDLIVEKALEFKLGARGLRSICEAIMLEAMYEFPSDENKKKLKITASYVKSQITKQSLSKLKAA